MSETCPFLIVTQLTPEMLEEPADRQIEIRTRTGLPLPLVDLQVLDLEVGDIPHDGKSTGEVVKRLPWLPQSYFRDPASFETFWQGGYLHTNDVGSIDPAGYLQITDRLKDVTKTGGEWISSLEIEDIHSQHPGVSEVAVIGVPNAKWGERPLAIVVPKAGQETNLISLSRRGHACCRLR